MLFCGIAQAHYTYNNLSKESQVATKEVGFLAFKTFTLIFVCIISKALDCLHILGGVKLKKPQQTYIQIIFLTVNTGIKTTCKQTHFQAGMKLIFKWVC